MRQATTKNKNNPDLVVHIAQRLREALMILLLALSAFLLLALTTFYASDPGWSQLSSSLVVKNSAGKAGAWFADIALYLFGYLAYLFPAMVAYSAYLLFKIRTSTEPLNLQLLAVRFVGFLLTLTTGCGLASLQQNNLADYPFGAGGVLGEVVQNGLIAQVNVAGTALLLSAILLIGITLATGLSWLRLSSTMASLIWRTGLLLQRRFLAMIAALRHWQLDAMAKRQENKRQKIANKKRPVKISTKENLPTVAKVSATSTLNIEKPAKPIKKSKRAEKERQLKLFDDGAEAGLPSFNLLEAPADKQMRISEKALQELSQLVELKLADFGINVEVVAVHPGPVITRFELQLAPGVKASRITSLARDLARSMAVMSVRVVEIIPGKPVVGLELPNEVRQIVRLQEVLASDAYERMASPLALALGKDISGAPVVVDLAKMPHLLVAGTTGSGKSVGLNGMLLSLLYKAQPSEVRLILIDPKMLELAVYDDIPHLLAPVVTDMKEAANALKWCVAEMERRYQLMAALGVRNLSGYNRKVSEAQKNNNPIADPTYQIKEGEEEEIPLLEAMPFIVVVVDEFADMIMVVGKKVEELIARIAQKARAAGIHLILATQRPSVDVITGLIKANVPTRIAFQVASRIDSRTILDQQGAEQLLGRGDMLYLPIGAGVPVRVHGAFVDDHEVHRVVNDWQSRGAPDYLEEIVNGSHGTVHGVDKALLMDDESETDDLDPLYDEAVMIVTDTRRASISLVQRKLKIGYNRAARLVEHMEAQGVVSAMQNNGSREVLAPPPVEL